MNIKTWLPLTLSLACAALGTWLVIIGFPALLDGARYARTDAQRQTAVADAVIAHGLAAGLFARDYGDVQDLLQQYSAIGYFGRGVITNANGQVVASVGVPDAVIGTPAPDSLRQSSRRIRLALRTEEFGHLYLPDGAAPGAARPSTAVVEERIATVRDVGVVLAVLAYLTLGALAIRLWLP